MAGKILIVDDVVTNRIILKVRLATACYEVLQAADGIAALDIARRDAPSLILLDIMMPGISGIEVCSQLRADPATRDIPIIMITGLDTPQIRLAAFEAGADAFMPKPVDETLLLARVRNLLRAHDLAAELRMRGATCSEMGFAEPEAEFRPSGRVGFVSQNPTRNAKWRRDLGAALGLPVTTLNRTGLLAQDSGKVAPALYVIDATEGNGGAGLQLLTELRARSHGRHATVAMLMPEAARADAAMALDLGASEILHHATPPDEAAVRLLKQMRIKHRADSLRASVDNGLRLAVIDPLTGLYNRRYGLSHLSRLALHSRESGQRLAVMLLDIDRFKAVNDRWGHAAGDHVLTEVAARLRDTLRPADLLARIGGEEFLVALPDSTLERAQACAERLCRTISGRPVALQQNSATVSVTVSIGLALGSGAGQPEPDRVAAWLMAEADAALMTAKAAGRNTVTVSRSAA